MDFNQEQINFLRDLGYLSKVEIQDLILGFTDLELLLDCEDLEAFESL